MTKYEKLLHAIETEPTSKMRQVKESYSRLDEIDKLLITYSVMGFLIGMLIGGNLIHFLCVK